MTTRPLHIVVAAAVGLLVAGSARAQLPSVNKAADPAAAAHWRALTEADVRAARDLIRDNHPGAAPELGDKALVANLDRAYAEAMQRAARADSLEAYVAVMAAFANAMGDKHVWARQDWAPRYVDWAGLAVAMRGDAWTVVDEDDAGASAPLKGARLVACDGVAVDAYAAGRLGVFRGVWSVPAQRISAAPWLLVDDGNPYLKRATSCDFETAAGRVSVALKWRSTTREAFVKTAAAAAPRGAAGFGVRPFKGGTWIAIQSLDDRAVPVVEAVEKDAAALRASPMIVLDLRGNGGGSSGYGRRVADALLGKAFTDARLGASTDLGGCEPIWRVSPGNLEQLTLYQRDLAPKVGPEFAALINRAKAATEKARVEGRALSADPAACKGAARSEPAPSGAAPRSAFKGMLVLLTDRVCFSSCLLVTDDFRKLGARHVGEATDANTHYMEVREVWTPSGLSRVSTLQAVGMEAPRQIGPFVPGEAFPGDISDTAALEAWIAALPAR